MEARAGEYHTLPALHRCGGRVGRPHVCVASFRRDGDRLSRDALRDARVRERRMRGAAGAEPAEVDVVALLRAADTPRRPIVRCGLHCAAWVLSESNPTHPHATPHVLES